MLNRLLATIAAGLLLASASAGFAAQDKPKAATSGAGRCAGKEGRRSRGGRQEGGQDGQDGGGEGRHRAPLGQRPRRPQAPQHRPGADVGPHRRRRGRPDRPEHVVRGRGLRRCVEDGERRHDVDAGLRRRGLRTRSAASRSIRRTRTRSRSAPARTSGAATSASATASTAASTPARAGRTSASRTRSTSRRSSCTRRTRTSCTWPRRGRCGRRAATAGSSRRPTAVRRGRRASGAGEWTGVTDVAIDPRDPDVLYAATWQRHRTVAAYMGGGPESGIHRSTDGGTTWEKLKKGLPEGPLGKIGLALSPQSPDVLYAAIELNRRTGAVYRSADRRLVWEKRSDTVSGGTGPHYYQELYASPHAEGRVYLVDVRMQVTEDGGKTFRRVDEKDKHSDNHAIAFRADDPEYLLVGTRRRALRELRPREDVAVRREPAGHAVLQDRGRRRRAVLQRVRRHAGQQHAGRPGAHRQR